MAKATVEIVCADCGQQFKHSKICYNRSQANDYEEWARENITQCPTCYKYMIEQSNAKKQEEKLEGIELVPLTGSEKQISWATKIRCEAMAMCAERKPNETFWRTINSKDDAKWWIDNRDELHSINSICKLLKKGKGE